MKRKTRLGKSKLGKRTSRIKKVYLYGDFDGDGVANVSDCDPNDPKKHFIKDPLPIDVKQAQKDVEDISQTLERFGKEVINLETDEDMNLKKNLRFATNLMKSHPNENVLLKIELEEEPEQGSGKIMMMRAEDFVNFDEIEAEDVDSGNVFSVRRDNVKKILGRLQMDSTPEFPETSTTLGKPMQMSTDREMQPIPQPVPVQSPQ